MMIIRCFMFYEDLAAKGLILSENIPHDEFSVINKEDIIKLFTHPKKLVYDSKDDVLSYINDDGKIIACPEISSVVSKAASWLSERLMIPPFDFEQDGDLIRVEEIESIHT
jgi:hypothetical protein